MKKYLVLPLAIMSFVCLSYVERDSKVDELKNIAQKLNNLAYQFQNNEEAIQHTKNLNLLRNSADEAYHELYYEVTGEPFKKDAMILSHYPASSYKSFTAEYRKAIDTCRFLDRYIEDPELSDLYRIALLNCIRHKRRELIEKAKPKLK